MITSLIIALFLIVVAISVFLSTFFYRMSHPEVLVCFEPPQPAYLDGERIRFSGHQRGEAKFACAMIVIQKDREHQLSWQSYNGAQHDILVSSGEFIDDSEILLVKHDRIEKGKSLKIIDDSDSPLVITDH